MTLRNSAGGAWSRGCPARRTPRPRPRPCVAACSAPRPRSFARPKRRRRPCLRSRASRARRQRTGRRRPSSLARACGSFAFVHGSSSSTPSGPDVRRQPPRPAGEHQSAIASQTGAAADRSETATVDCNTDRWALETSQAIVCRRSGRCRPAGSVGSNCAGVVGDRSPFGGKLVGFGAEHRSLTTCVLALLRMRISMNSRITLSRLTPGAAALQAMLPRRRSRRPRSGSRP